MLHKICFQSIQIQPLDVLFHILWATCKSSTTFDISPKLLIVYLLTLPFSMDMSWAVIMLQPGQTHLTQRKMIRRGIGPQRVESYDTSIEAEIGKLMVDLASHQGDPNLTVRQYVRVSFTIHPLCYHFPVSIAMNWYIMIIIL